MSPNFCIRPAIVCFLLFLFALPAAGQSDRVELRAEAEQESEMILEKYPEYARFIVSGEAERVETSDGADVLRRSSWDRSVALRGADVQVWLTSELIEQIWDAEAGDWLNDARIAYTRDASGGTIETLLQEWDADAGAWVNSLRISNDREEMSGETLYEEWDLEANAGEGGWVAIQRFLYTYNEQGNTLTSTHEVWDSEAGSYFIFSRSTYTYDSSGERVLQRLAESGLFGPLEPSFRYSFTYDDDGNDIEELVENYNTMDEWENYRLEQRAYDEFGEEIEELIQDWDLTANGGAGAWVNSELTVVEFSPDSQEPTETVETDQVWDPAANDGEGAWLNTNRNLFEYDATANTYVDTDQVWDVGAGDWVNDARWTYHLSEDDELLEFINEVWDTVGGGWVNSERGTAEFNEEGLTSIQLIEVWEDMAWVNSSRTLFSYEEFGTTAAENETPGQRFELGANFPNPFRGTTAISFTVAAPEHVTLEVFDMLGRRVSTLVDAVKMAGKHEVVLDASGLAAGLYVYRLSSDNRQESRTMLLVR